MRAGTEGLLDLLEQAREADLSTRIEFRNSIGAHGIDAITEIRSWLADPAMVSFAIRVIEKAASVDATRIAWPSRHSGAFAGVSSPRRLEAMRRQHSSASVRQSDRRQSRGLPVRTLPRDPSQSSFAGTHTGVGISARRVSLETCIRESAPPRKASTPAYFWGSCE